jgi:hypothetical protein
MTPQLVWGISCQGVIALLFAFLGRLIFWFDPRGGIFPSRPHVSLAVARSGGQGWPPIQRPPEGLVLD